MVSGHLVGPGANLSFGDFLDSSFEGADLTNVDLSQAQLGGANLTLAHGLGINLSNAELFAAFLPESGWFGVVGTPKTLPAGWVLSDSSILKGLRSAEPSILSPTKVGLISKVNPGSWEEGTEFSFVWLLDGDKIANANTAEYLIQPSDYGHEITVKVTGSKKGHAAVSRTSKPALIEKGLFNQTPTPSIEGQLRVGKVVSVEVGQWDEGAQLNIKWLRDGVAVGAGLSYAVGVQDFKRLITVEVTATKLGYAGVVKSSSGAPVGLGHIITQLPKISGTVKSGTTVRCLTKPWVSGAKIKYQWLVNGAVIKGATSTSFKITPSLRGKKLSVKVTQSANGFSSAVRASAGIAVK